MGRVTAVHDVCWCPNDATIFAAATEDGGVEIWDLEASVLDPIVSSFPNKKQSQEEETHLDDSTVKDAPIEKSIECVCVSFAPRAPVVIVGDTDGNVTVYRVRTLAEKRYENVTEEEQAARLQRAIHTEKVIM